MAQQRIVGEVARQARAVAAGDGSVLAVTPVSRPGVAGRQAGQVVLVVGGPLGQLGERAAGEGLAQRGQLVDRAAALPGPARRQVPS